MWASTSMDDSAPTSRSRAALLDVVDGVELVRAPRVSPLDVAGDIAVADFAARVVHHAVDADLVVDDERD